MNKKLPPNEALLLIEYAEKKGLLSSEQANTARQSNITDLDKIENLIISNGWLIPKELENLFKDYARHVWNHSAIQFGKIAVHNKFISKPVFDEILIQQKINKNAYGGDQNIGEVLIQKKLLTRNQVNAITQIQDELVASDINYDITNSNLHTEETLQAFSRLPFSAADQDKTKSLSEFQKNIKDLKPLAIRFENDTEGFIKYIKFRLKGHYEIIETFDKKSVFLTAIAKDLITNKKVVLKILKAGKYFSSDTALTYYGEILALTKIRHQNLAEIIDFGHIECFPYFSHIYVEGINLKEYFNKADPSIKNKVSHIMIICDALIHMHEKMIYHKNLSSNNLIFTKEEQPIFLNYGLSRSVTSQNNINEYNYKIDLMIDYLNYISPEEIAGKNDEITESSEVYSIGVILYELCTGQLPYDLSQCDLFLALTKIREEQPWPPIMYNNEISQQLEWVILKTLAKDKKRRYQTIKELKEDLQRFLNNENVLAKPLIEETESITIRELKNKYTLHFRVLITIITLLLLVVAVLAAMPDQAEIKNARLINTTSKATKKQSQYAAEKNIPISIKDSFGINFVLVPNGFFEMGSNELEEFRHEDEILHEIQITNGFYLSETEITQKQWFSIMNYNPSEFKGDDLPVENISWLDIQKFINELNKKSNNIYRLPTEAEWEIACRAGTTSSFNVNSSENSFAWDNTKSPIQTQKVKQLVPNAYGLYDMHNNVWEWCQDYYDKYNTNQLIDPQGPITGSEKVMRGGAFNSLSESSRSASRRSRKPQYQSNAVGFRLVQEIHSKSKK